MNQRHHDINDDEIRVISADSRREIPSSLNVKKLLVFCALAMIAVCCFLFFVMDDSEEVLPTGMNPESPHLQKGHVEVYDTTINHVPLSVFVPRHVVPKLHVGTDALKDEDAVFVVPAADIREDNGGIVGAYVLEGNLISKGQAKSGFCAIIGGRVIVGVADATPYLEQAIESGGYFFRQYPLVVGNQVVENKPKGKSFRKALAEWNDEIVVIMSKKTLTFHDFAQSLSELGVSNAIYLVGASASGFAIDSQGNRIVFGVEETNASKNTNYIVWK